MIRSWSTSCFLIYSLFTSAILGWILFRGAEGLTLQYLLEPPIRLGREGGIGPILVSTILVNGMALFFALFLGLPVATVLASLTTRAARLSRYLRLILSLLAGTPSIVFGLFGHVFFCRFLGLGYSLLSGALTLSLMILPLFVRFTEQSLRSLPEDYQRASQSLGLSESTYFFKVALPAIWSPLVSGLIICWTRAVSEAACLLFTAGYSVRFPESLLDSGRVLSVHVFEMSMNVTGGDAMAYRAAFVLLVLSVFMILIARVFARIVGAKV